MKIAIEAQRIFRKNKHGMDFVALETIRELQQIDKTNEYYILVSPGEDKCLKETSNFHIIEIRVPSYPLWEQVGLPLALKKIKPDLLHCTSNTAPLFGNVPLVLTLHDVIFMEKKHGTNTSLYQRMGWYYRRWNVPRILTKCKRIITVSNFEAKRICHTMNFAENSVTPVYNGFSKHFHPLDKYEDIVSKYCPENNYFFFLGNTDPKKNTLRTLKAYAIYLKESSNPSSLLIADLSEKDIDNYLTEGGIEYIKPHLRFPGYIANTDLPAIYNGAKAFIYTSLRESFGIPLLEAMACGTPVISSNTSAIPEVAGKDAILVDPTDEKAIAREMLRLEEDEALRQRQIEYGKERAKRFSWKQTAEKLLEIYQSVQ